MPDGLLPAEGIGQQLECILSRTVSGVPPWGCILWVNDITPTAATVLDDLVEATWSGYSPMTLPRSDWTTPVVTYGCAVSTWGTTPIVWYVTGGPSETVYGYALVDTTAGVIRYVQRFEEADIEPVEVGGRVSLLPRYTLTSCACP